MNLPKADDTISISKLNPTNGSNLQNGLKNPIQIQIFQFHHLQQQITNLPFHRHYLHQIIMKMDLVSRWKSSKFCTWSNKSFAGTQCSFRRILKKSIWSYISNNYLTTNEPYLIKFQKFQKIRKLNSPDPDSGSEIRKIWKLFFS